MLRDLNKSPFYPNELGVIAAHVVVSGHRLLYVLFFLIFWMFAGGKTGNQSVSKALILQYKKVCFLRSICQSWVLYWEPVLKGFGDLSMWISIKGHWYLSSQLNIHVCEGMEDAMRKTGIVVRGIFSDIMSILWQVLNISNCCESVFTCNP